MKKLFCLFVLLQFSLTPVCFAGHPSEEEPRGGAAGFGPQELAVVTRDGTVPRLIWDRNLFDPRAFTDVASRVHDILTEGFRGKYGGHTEEVRRISHDGTVTIDHAVMKPIGFSPGRPIPHYMSKHEDGHFRTVLFRYPSFSHPFSRFLKTGDIDRGPENLTEMEGFLILPGSSAGSTKQHPIAVLSHGSGGINDYSLHYVATLLATRGIATFIPYHYFSRGIYQTGSDQFQISQESQLDDIGFGLMAISSLFPEIDTERTILCGFSRGAGVVDLMSRDEYARAFIPPETGIVIRGIASFFPEIVAHQKELSLTGVPLLYLCGSLDDYTPAAGIGEHVSRILLHKPTYDVKCIFFEGGHHSFFPPTLEDLKGIEPTVEVASAQVLTDSRFKYNPHAAAEGFTPLATPDEAPTPWRDFGRFMTDHAREAEVHFAASVEISYEAILAFLDFASSKTSPHMPAAEGVAAAGPAAAGPPRYL
jgi:dienelactone hydrolase